MKTDRPPIGSQASRPPFDPELANVLDSLGYPPVIDASMIPEMRALDPRLPSTFASDNDLQQNEVEFEANGRKVRLSVLRSRDTGNAPLPCIYFIHGGGMMWGNRFSGLESMIEFIDRGAACITVEYSLAPEHPDPAPLQDCYAGLEFAFNNAAEWNIDPARILVAGISAGAGLAAGTVLFSRDRGGPRPRAQLLIAPMLDDRNSTVSSVQFSGVGIWSRESNETGWRALLGDRAGTQDVSEYSAPARNVDHTGLPPTFLEVGSAEVFRDEVVSFAESIWRDGGSAELHVWSGAFHGFDGFAPSAAVSASAQRARRSWVSSQLWANLQL